MELKDLHEAHGINNLQNLAITLFVKHSSHSWCDTRD